MGVSLPLQMAVDCVGILTVLILLALERGVSFHLYLQFLSSESCGFHCTDLSLPWLNLFLSILLFLCYCERDFFFFQNVIVSV